MTITTEQAVALAETHMEAMLKRGAAIRSIEFTVTGLTEMLNDNEQQIRSDERQRLAEQSGVMPRVTIESIDGREIPFCRPKEVREALAKMQAKLDFQTKAWAKEHQECIDLQARVEQLERVLDNCKGNINPERGYAEELEAEIDAALKGQQ
jgi:hypothetical protein